MIREEFIKLHYPLYWHYDVLGIVIIFSESGHTEDERCNEAVDRLMEKYIDGEGWPAEKKYYKASDKFDPGNDYVDWGGTSRRAANQWVTADALFVLKSKGVFQI